MNGKLLVIAKAFDDLRWLPIALWIAVPALLVRGIYVPVAPDAAAFYTDITYGDTRSWWKAAAVVGIALWMALHAILRLTLGWRPRQKKFGIIVLSAMAATLGSAFLSDYPYTAWVGFTSLYEGAWVLLSYLFATWYAAEQCDKELWRIWLVRVMGLVCLINVCIGIGEGVGWILWDNDFGRWLMGAAENRVVRRTFDGQLASGTVFQPNHFGMFMAMLGAVALGMAFYEKAARWRIFWCVNAGGALVALVFSQSRAGMLVFALIALGYLGARCVGEIRKRNFRYGFAWRVFLPLAILAAALFSLPQARAALKRLGTRFTIISISGKTDLPTRTVSLLDNKIRVETDDGVAVLAPHGGDAWTLGGITPGTEKPIAVTRERGGWKEARIPGMHGVVLSYRPEGAVRLRLPDARMDFYRAAGRVYAVDSNFRLISELLPSSYIPNGYEGIFTGRGYIWRRCLEVFRRHPWFGSGPGALGLVYPNDDLLNKRRFISGEDEDKAHGIWMGLLTQLGLAGLATYGFVAWHAVRCSLTRCYGLRDGIVLGMAAYLAGSLTNDSTVGVTPIFCALVGLSVAGSDGVGASVPPS